jgi:hypothetical protein
MGAEVRVRGSGWERTFPGRGLRPSPGYGAQGPVGASRERACSRGLESQNLTAKRKGAKGRKGQAGKPGRVGRSELLRDGRPIGIGQSVARRSEASPGPRLRSRAEASFPATKSSAL